MIFITHILSKNEHGEFDCPVCYETVPKTKRVTQSCGHIFCCECTKEWLHTCSNENKQVTCPMCRYSSFLLETPDEKQFQEISRLLERISADQLELAAFMYHHFVF